MVDKTKARTKADSEIDGSRISYPRHHQALLLDNLELLISSTTFPFSQQRINV